VKVSYRLMMKKFLKKEWSPKISLGTCRHY